MQIRGAQSEISWFYRSAHGIESDPGKIVPILNYRHYYICGGKLFKKSKGEMALMVVPNQLISTIASDYHGSLFGGHFGISKTLTRITQIWFLVENSTSYEQTNDQKCAPARNQTVQGLV